MDNILFELEYKDAAPKSRKTPGGAVMIAALCKADLALLKRIENKLDRLIELSAKGA